MTPALFKDEGWQLNEGTQHLLTCDTGIPTWVPGGIVIGANVVASAKVIAGAAATVGQYRSAIYNYAASVADAHLIDTNEASSLNACLGDPETLAQWEAWNGFVPSAPVTLSRGVLLSGQRGVAGSSTVYTLDVPAGAFSLNLRTMGGKGDVSIYVKLGGEASPTDFTWKSVHAGTNSESVMIPRPVAGTYYLTVVGAANYSGVTILGNFTQR